MSIEIESDAQLAADVLRTEPRDVAVLRRAEVIVVGGGIAGIFAALAAAREGANTLLVERFGAVGGHCGPGLGTRHDLWQHPTLNRKGLGGVVGEFLQMLEREGGLRTFEFNGLGEDNWGWDGMPPLPVIERETFMALALRLMAEANVTVLLNSQVTDVILQGKRACGLTVQNPCGAQAVLGDVVIDCSGDAVVAGHCGKGFLPSPPFSSTGTGLLFEVSGVDWQTYHEYDRDARRRPRTAEEETWLEEVFYPTLGSKTVSWCKGLLPLIKEAWESGEYEYVQDADGLAKLYLVPFGVHDRSLAVVQYGPDSTVDTTNPIHLSKVESKSRCYIYDTVRFFRRHVPGWEEACISQIAPFMGARYNRYIDSDFKYENEDIWQGRRFADVVHGLTHLYKNWSGVDRERELVDMEHGEEGVEYEVPYRLLLVKGIEGVLAAGRHINSNPQSRLRGRWMTMLTGAIAGIAGTIAVRAGVTPRNIEVSVLQQKLVQQGYHLGSPERLEQLGLPGEPSPEN